MSGAARNGAVGDIEMQQSDSERGGWAPHRAGLRRCVGASVRLSAGALVSAAVAERGGR